MDNYDSKRALQEEFASCEADGAKKDRRMSQDDMSFMKKVVEAIRQRYHKVQCHQLHNKLYAFVCNLPIHDIHDELFSTRMQLKKMKPCQQRNRNSALRRYRHLKRRFKLDER